MLAGIGVLALCGFVAVKAWNIYFADDQPVVADSAPEDAADSTPAGVRFIPTGISESTAGKNAAARHQQQRVERLNDTIRPFLQKHCADCHGPDSEEAGIDVTQLQSPDQLLEERETWERVYRMVNAGAMPPADYDPQPSAESKNEVSELLYEELFNFDCKIVYNAGRPTVQRLNRAEYNNTVCDLFGIDVSPADQFPADDVGEGFDNIGDVLSLPPLLMEKYLNAAEQVATAVIDTTDYSKPHTTTLEAGSLRSTGRLSGGAQFLSTNGRITGEFDVAASGDYEIRVRAFAQQMGNEKARFRLSKNNDTVGEFDVQQHMKNEDFARTVRLEKGRTQIVAAFLNDAYDAKQKKDRNFAVRQIAIHGPLGGSEPQYSEAHRRIVTATPMQIGSVREAAGIVLKPVMKRAFRRPVSMAEVSRYAGLVERAVNEMGESYEGGLSLALQAVLVAPDFLFRLEKEPAPGKTERLLDEYEVASRLSYFLWSTMPDDELFQLADNQTLLQPDVLRQQIQRMLKDDRADALVQNFASQWLNLRNLDEVSPDPRKFTTFNDELKRDMRKETELVFRAVMAEDRSVEDLLSADFTFLNERLAQHYQISGISGEDFERVSLQQTQRTGILTHASILTLTSDPGRTSPVKRGKWIMENIFGEAPPPPPPNVPELEVTANASPDASLREQLEKHRQDPGCAACHDAMDPLGLGFENFDAIGRWRTSDDNGKPINASGSLPSGESFQNSTGLIAIIKGRREKFFRTLAERMLTYAVGRGTKYYDRCAVDRCLELMKQRNNRFSALIEGIVLSDPFLKRSGATAGLDQKVSLK